MFLSKENCIKLSNKVKEGDNHLPLLSERRQWINFAKLLIDYRYQKIKLKPDSSSGIIVAVNPHEYIISISDGFLYHKEIKFESFMLCNLP